MNGGVEQKLSFQPEFLFPESGTIRFCHDVADRGITQAQYTRFVMNGQPTTYAGGVGETA